MKDKFLSELTRGVRGTNNWYCLRKTPIVFKKDVQWAWLEFLRHKDNKTGRNHLLRSTFTSLPTHTFDSLSMDLQLSCSLFSAPLEPVFDWTFKLLSGFVSSARLSRSCIEKKVPFLPKVTMIWTFKAVECFPLSYNCSSSHQCWVPWLWL